MDVFALTVLFLLGMGGGLLSGLLGIGGGIVMFPLLLEVPPLLGMAAFGIKTAAAITSVQSFAGALSGALGHHRFGRISGPLVWCFGGSMSLTALLGSWLSARVPELLIMLVFAGMAICASLLMLLPRRPVDDSDDVHGATTRFHHRAAVGWGGLLGLLSGIVGQGGGFLFVPVMLHLLHIPTRIAVGSALLVGILSSFSVMLGRIGTFQVPWLESVVVVVGAIAGAQLGARFSQRVPGRWLRILLSLIIVFITLRVIAGLIG